MLIKSFRLLGLVFFKYSVRNILKIFILDSEYPKLSCKLFFFFQVWVEHSKVIICLKSKHKHKNIVAIYKKGIVLSDFWEKLELEKNILLS